MMEPINLKKMKQKLYLVEFGESDKPGWMTSMSEYVYVSAETYNQAIGKALRHKEHSGSIVTQDGSLMPQGASNIKVVKLLAEELIL